MAHGRAFKNLINQALGASRPRVQLQRADPGFDAKRFVRLASQGLEALEMKARAMHICRRAGSHPAADFARAARVSSKRRWHQPKRAKRWPSLQGLLQRGLRGWILWPVGEYIARRGQATPERACWRCRR
jgi:hypothetical protein